MIINRKWRPLWILQRLRSHRQFKQARRQGNNDPISVKLYGQRVLLRPCCPDWEVAIASLGSEFNPLCAISEVVGRDFDGLIIDGGGYIGTAAIRLSQIWPRATVVTIEPSHENFWLLERNIAGWPKIHGINGALVSEATFRRPLETTLFDRGTGAWGFTVVEGTKGDALPKALHRIKKVTLAEIRASFNDMRIAVVKLDIEGGEKALFDGQDRDLMGARAVFVELHERIVDGCNAAFERFSRDWTVSRSGGEKFLAVRPS